MFWLWLRFQNQWQCEVLLAPGPALGGWGAPRTWKLGPQLYNTLHLTHSTYVNKNIDLTNAYKSIFYSISTTYKADRLKHSLCFKLGKWLFQVLKNANVFVNSVTSNVLAVSLSIDITAKFVSLSSVVVDLWNILISLNLLKIHSAVLHTAVIGKLSLGRQWKGTQAPFPLVSEETFPGGTTLTFCLYFSGLRRCNANGRSQNFSPFYTKKLLHFTAIVTKNAFPWQQ